MSSGRQDNIFWRRLDGDPAGQIEAAGAKSIGLGEVQALGEKLIHSVTNPTSDFTAAIHIYGGDFFAQARSEWDPQPLQEQSYDIIKTSCRLRQKMRFLGCVKRPADNDS
jgi:predicted metal-dependent enzyme (double-stranded beta helix superfamily)